MIKMSRAFDISDFDGNTILVGSDDLGFEKYVCISGFENINFSTEDKVIDILSLLGNNKFPTPIAVGKNIQISYLTIFIFLRMKELKK